MRLERGGAFYLINLARYFFGKQIYRGIDRFDFYTSRSVYEIYMYVWVNKFIIQEGAIQETYSRVGKVE